MVKTEKQSKSAYRSQNGLLVLMGAELGILAVQMNMDLINSAIAEREENTVLLYNDVNVLYTNYEVSGTEELALETYLRSTTRWTGNTRFSVIGKDRFVTYKKVHPQNTTNYYSLVSVQDYSGITEQSRIRLPLMRI